MKSEWSLLGADVPQGGALWLRPPRHVGAVLGFGKRALVPGSVVQRRVLPGAEMERLWRQGQLPRNLPLGLGKGTRPSPGTRCTPWHPSHRGAGTGTVLRVLCRPLLWQNDAVLQFKPKHCLLCEL